MAKAIIKRENGDVETLLAVDYVEADEYWLTIRFEDDSTRNIKCFDVSEYTVIPGTSDLE
jgi:hypothetical protein